MMPAKTQRTRGTRKRELLTVRGDKRFVRRDGQGRFKESDDVGAPSAWIADVRPKQKSNRVTVIAATGSARASKLRHLGLN